MSYNTYIINLKQDTDKYNRIKQRLDNINIKFKRFDAIYGKDIGNKYDQIIWNKEYIPKSVIGCGLSHYLVCKSHFDNDKNKIAMILEDDAVPLFDNKTVINKIINDAPKDWDIILLYTQGVTNYKDNTWETGDLMGSTMAYLINYNGFEKRYGNNYQLYTHTDLERCFSKCKVYKTPNMYFKPEFSESSTSSNNKYYGTVYNFLDNLFYNELETALTGFSGSMASRYKIIRLPYIDYEFDFLDLIFTILIIFSIIFVMLSKKKLNTYIDCIVYCLTFFALVIACVKIYVNILN